MAQLWGGRFTKETDQLVYNFNASISFDKRFYAQDIKGSMAHVTMLAKQGILTEDDKEQIIAGLTGILNDVESGELEISHKYEDIHSFVEATLIDRIGEAGKRLHTGRSRNDQVALDMKLYTRDEVEALNGLVKELLNVILSIMEENTETYMPGFTHLQKAQPITLAHHMGAYFEMFKRDHERLCDIHKRMNTCPSLKALWRKSEHGILVHAHFGIRALVITRPEAVISCIVGKLCSLSAARTACEIYLRTSLL